MEMHQVRYFLAIARTLNFTRAAEECHVAQPSLTRAMHQLEGELGGDLFRRERPHAQLTELGQRMLPLLGQCYNSAIEARSLASALKSGQIGALRLALSHTIDVGLLVPCISELSRQFQGMELKFLRDSATGVAECLKQGQAELALAAPIGEAWDRLDSWPLFTEGFELIVSQQHRLANREAIEIEELRGERLLVRTYCEQGSEVAELLGNRGIDVGLTHELSSERDLVALLEANVGVAIVPRSFGHASSLKRAQIGGLDLRRTVYLYGVAGRQRTPVAGTAMKLLRSSSWTQFSG